MPDISKERARIARELHDGIAQELAAIGYAIDSEIGRSDTSAHSRQSLRQIRERLTDLNSKVREEIFLLRDSHSLEAHQQLMQSLQSLPVDADVTGNLPNDETGIELFKTLQELARNAVEHGNSTRVTVEISALAITFTSDGFAPTINSTDGFGVIGISERLDAIGWTISYESGFSNIRLLKGK